MIEFFWICLITGITLAVVSLFAGDLLESGVDSLLEMVSLEGPDFLHPMTLLGGVTIFGGAGIMLSEFTTLEPWPVLVLALATAVGLSVVLHFAYVKPMKRAENSMGYSIRELQGKIGEVSVPIRSSGYGEVMIRAGGVPTYQLAGSFDGSEMPEGASVIVVEIREGALYVAPFDPPPDTNQKR